MNPHNHILAIHIKSEVGIFDKPYADILCWET